MHAVAAAVQGIEAINSGEVGVRSLQSTRRACGGIRGVVPPVGTAGGVMTHGDIEGEAGPVQVRGTVLTVRRIEPITR